MRRWPAPTRGARRALGALAACASLHGVGSPARALAAAMPSPASSPAPAPATVPAPAAAPAPVPAARPRSEWLSVGAAALWAGRLGEAQRALLEVADREIGRSDPALDFWSELSALLRCDPGPVGERPGRRLANEWDRLRRLVQIERIRLAPKLEANAPAGKGIARTLPLSPPPDSALTWPLENERWPDEAPAARSVLDHCAPAEATPAEGAPASSPSSSAPASTVASRAAEAALVNELTAALPAGHPALPALLLDQAVLAIARGDAAGAQGPLDHMPDGAAAPGGPFSPDERAQLAMARALAADGRVTSADTPEAAVAAREAAVTLLRAALATEPPLPLEARRALTFRLAEDLRALGRADEAVAAVGPPPHGNDLLGRYLAFRQMDAHVRAGRRAEAIAEAREALGPYGRATVDSDAALAAIDDLALRLLVASPISTESIELIEALGKPSERLGRVERFAQLAGAARSHASEMEAFLWLRQNDPDGNRQLHHLARASVAAARAGDGKQFALTFGELAQQGDGGDAKPGLRKDGTTPGSPTPAAGTQGGKPPKASGFIDSPEAERLYRARQMELSLSWQRAMLIVARDALPSLVENDDQPNLKTLVDRLQRHLTAHGRGPVDAELTTVYRAASAHLRGGARAYAERVGKNKRPILLGDIAVERHYEVPVPTVPVMPRGPGSLLWVPATGDNPSPAALKRWPRPLGISVAAADVKTDSSSSSTTRTNGRTEDRK